MQFWDKLFDKHHTAIFDLAIGSSVHQILPREEEDCCTIVSSSFKKS
jgi:hypothetical protein